MTTERTILTLSVLSGRAQGFPDSYVLTGTKTSQVARIGNSVPPPIVRALVEANCPELARAAA